MFERRNLVFVIVLLFVIDAIFWFQILIAPDSFGPSELYFFEVGQGDAELLKFPGGVKVLVDGGPDNSVLSALDSVLSPFDRYIDLVVLSHPETDHFSGLIEVVRRYETGIFLWGGQKASTNGFVDLASAVSEKKALSLVISEGDKIKYRDSIIEVLSPSAKLPAGNSTNDLSLVFKVYTGGVTSLFTGDIGFLPEKDILARHDLNVDVLKVPHHGSKNSSGMEFLNELSPKVSVIGVGRNSYGHPAREALERLALAGSQIFRTDRDGTVKLIFDQGTIRVLRKKSSLD